MSFRYYIKGRLHDNSIVLKHRASLQISGQQVIYLLEFKYFREMRVFAFCFQDNKTYALAEKFVYAHASFPLFSSSGQSDTNNF